MRTCLSSMRPVTLLVTIVVLALGQSPTAASLFTVDFDNLDIYSFPALIACHLAHWSSQHLFWDLVMFIGLGWQLERSAPRSFYITLFTSVLLIPLCVGLLQPEIASYRGLSGIDTALFGLLCTLKLFESLKSASSKSTAVFVVLLLLMWAKLLFELLTGGLLFVHSANFAPVPSAHLCGALIGMMVAGVTCRVQVASIDLQQQICG